MNWELFIGRFHPLMVHLPIGIFILGYLFELLWQFGFRELIPSRKIITATYIVGLLAGVAAAFTGWLLASSNDYFIEPLDDHKWLGISTLVVMSLVIFFQIKASEDKGKLKLVAATVAIILVALTGHFGGNLTHGSTYLSEYGPSVLSGDDVASVRLNELQPDSVIIYAHLIQPIIEAKCVACHNKENSFGGLALDSYALLFKEADHEVPVQPGSPDKSEFLHRVSLPADHEKVMPPRGAQLSFTEVQVLRYWITQGADSLATFDSEKMSPELIALINRDYGLDFSPKPYYEKIKVDSLPEAVFAELRGAGFRVSYLGETNLLLDVSYEGDSITSEKMNLLASIARQVTFLKLSNCRLTNELLQKMTVFPHLTRIDLSKNQLADQAVLFLIQHPHLTAVNLNETQTKAASLTPLLSQEGLSVIYLWQTGITEEELQNLRKSYPSVDIVSQFSFQKVDEKKSVFEQATAR